MPSSNLMDLMNTDFSDEDSSEDESNVGGMTSKELFEKYGKIFPVHEAVEAGDRDAIGLALRKAGNLDFNPDDELVDDVSIDQRDKNECTPLHVAILKRQLDCMEECLERGAKVSGPEALLLGSHPLHLTVAASAIAKDKSFALAATNMILDRITKQQKSRGENAGVATFKLRDANGRTPLHLATRYAASDVVSALFAAVRSQDGARRMLMSTDKLGRTAFHVVAEYAHRTDREIMMKTIKALVTGIALSGMGMEDKTTLMTKRDEDGMSAVEMMNAASPRWSEGIDAFSAIAKTSSSASPSSPPALMMRRAATSSEQRERTLIVTHPTCWEGHFTCPPSVMSRHSKELPPSENVKRLTVLCDDRHGALRSKEFQGLRWTTAKKAALADVVRCHEYAYVASIQRLCEEMGHEMQTSDDKSSSTKDKLSTRTIDRDSTISRESYDAALYACGATIQAVTSVVRGETRNAFCAVRPPGHHAGPRGKVASIYDQCGSHGFCIFNNAAVAAAYARTVLRDDVKRVAILDFDVHHGNGTEAILRNLKPSVRRTSCRGSFLSPGFQTTGETNALQLGLQRLEARSLSYKPWKDEEDVSDMFFASTHGYGKTAPEDGGGQMYPGSGATCGVTFKPNCVLNGKEPRKLYGLAPEQSPDEALSSIPWTNTDALRAAVKNAKRARASCISGHLNGIFDKVWDGRMINCGMDRFVRLGWRLTWLEHILPALHKFNPDLILISAGFDAHFQDEINHGFIGLVEDDYAWLTRRIVQLANDRCHGRVVSVLEGGYRVQGDACSPLARSVAAHVRSLEDTPAKDTWTPDSECAKWEIARLKKMITESKGWTCRPCTTNGATTTTTTPSASAEDAPRRKRRRRNNVDYAKLNAEMEKERTKKLETNQA